MRAEPASRVTGCVSIRGRDVDYRVSRARPNSRRRIRVGVGGVEVLDPGLNDPKGVEEFVQTHGDWVLDQLDRIDRLRSVRRVHEVRAGEILFRGVPTAVGVDEIPWWKRSNRVLREHDRLVVARGQASTRPPSSTLENWMRRQARAAIAPLVDSYAATIGATPGRLYIMDQRTKWGNCSSLGNLSFNWRIVMAPEAVLRYLVAHEVVHLVVPDHSQRFWLTVQSICPETERSRQWLVAHGHHLLVDLAALLTSADALIT
jgi:predicted metal-dependent hydrolase